MMYYTGEFSDKFGNSLGMQATHAEAWAQVLGIQSQKIIIYYEQQKDGFKMQKQITESAKGVMETLHTINFVTADEKDQSKVDDWVQKWERVNLIGAAYEKAGWGAQFRTAMQMEMDKAKNKGIKGPIARLFKSHVDGISAKEAMMEDKLKRLEGTIGPEGTDRIRFLTMEIPKVNIDFEDKRWR